MDEDKVFDNEQIRDTATHNSDESASGEFLAKTVFVENGLNELATLQMQGARASTWVNIGIPFNVTAGSNSYQTVSDYFPKYRLTASCSQAPTSGALNVWIIKAR